ncbi:MAG: alpha/beta fold hydrolase [Phycisphaerales bacterium]
MLSTVVRDRCWRMAALALAAALGLAAPGEAFARQAEAPAAPPAAPASPAPVVDARAKPGSLPVKVVDENWRDEARKRDVPVRIYMPGPVEQDKSRRYPVIVFSHGLWGSRQMYSYFGEHMASHGYIVVTPSHPGSDTASLMKAGGGGEKPNNEGGMLKAAISDPENLKNRPKDVSFVIDEIARHAKLKDVADLTRVGVAGHSFGAYTAMAAGGMTVDLPEAKGTSFRDERVKAVLPMSPEGPGTMGITDSSWDALAVPVLFLTGTKDYGEGQRPAEWRRAGFEHVQGVDAYLVTLAGAGHMTFGMGGEKDADSPTGALRERIRERLAERVGTGLGGAGSTAAEQQHHTEMIKALSLAFFDAYLRGDAEAKKWLAAYSMAKHSDCVAEFRPGVMVKITVDASEAPDLKEWGEKSKAICEKWYPLLLQALPSEGFVPRSEVAIVFKPEMRVPAATGGGTISVNAAYVRQHKDDYGMMVHELTHVVQAYPNRPRRAPGWLVEGVADYTRFYLYEPGADRSRINPEKASYRDSYRTTARFLDYLVRTHDPEIVKKLNASMRAGECDEAKFKEIVGADVDELWKAFLASLAK